MQDCGIFIAKALGILQSYAKPSICDAVSQYAGGIYTVEGTAQESIKNVQHTVSETCAKFLVLNSLRRGQNLCQFEYKILNYIIYNIFLWLRHLTYHFNADFGVHGDIPEDLSHWVGNRSVTSCHSPADTLRNNNVVITSKRRHFDVTMSKWHRFNVITTLLLRQVFGGSPLPWPVLTEYYATMCRHKGVE